MIKDLVVHLEGSGEDETKLLHGEVIAAQYGAHLTGLYTNALPDYALAVPIEAAPTSAATMAELEQRARDEGASTMRRLAERFARSPVQGEVVQLADRLDALETGCVSRARCADLFLATTPHRPQGETAWDFLIESVLFGSGRGVYLVPPGKLPNGPSADILVAWRNGREAARAVSEALPFLGASKRTLLLAVDPPPERSEDAMQLLAAHLLRHGVPIETRTAESQGRSVGDVILEEAHSIGAGLIVMGAYGHSRLREWILGGATRTVVERTDVPILMAH